MGKKNKATGLGKSLIRDRFGKQNRDRPGEDTFLHTSDLNDGYDWGRLNLQSVTEQNNLEEFLSTAELAGTEFTAEKMNIKVIQKDVYGGLPHGEELVRIENLHRQHKDSIRIPRRPYWDREMSASDVDKNEKAAFLEWRRSLALLQEVDGIVLTPYEKNLDFWRQLWRVVERSDVIVQIVDARNPLLFYCTDLEVYVREVDPTKQCVVLINKADFLTKDQREAWVEYFNNRNVRVAFWSAIAETQRQEEALKQEVNSIQDKHTTDIVTVTDTESLVCRESDNVETGIDTDDDDSENSDKDIWNGKDHDSNNDDDDDKESLESDMKTAPKNCDEIQAGLVDNAVANRVNECHIAGDNLNLKSDHLIDTSVHVKDQSDHVISKTDHVTSNSGHMYTGPELLDFFRSLRPRLKLITVGMVGYPNVGKSSTINAILKMKKVPVSATPGRTKHFQTLFVDKDLMVCDCPGLVFPSFVTTKADLVVSGILPIDQMRDHVPPTSLICNLIPRKHLEKVYGIIISKPREGEDPNRRPTAEEFLNAYGAMRGYMNARGLPDCPRSSRYVLKDYVNGKLLFCHPPPGINPEDFNSFSNDTEVTPDKPTSSEVIIESSAIDKEFFQKEFSRSHTRTARSGCKDVANNMANDKPWRKHNNKKKKEKLRRVYAHLDKH